MKKVLDHGFVVVRNLSGPFRRPQSPFDAYDTDPAATARMSFDNFDSLRSEADDLKLCNYLMKNWHTTPFEMIEIWVEMKLPIFVARQFVRHRTCSINEVSGRYVTLPEEWYIPEVVGGKPTGGAKQGQEDCLPAEIQKEMQKDLDWECSTSYQKYLYYIDKGVAPEHARMFLHLNHYTHWIWKQDLHNMMHFLSLRVDPHAQIEARMYAQAIIEVLDIYLPESMKLFRKYRSNIG